MASTKPKANLSGLARCIIQDNLISEENVITSYSIHYTKLYDNFVRSEMSRRQSVVARGGTFPTDTTAEWITALNNSGGTAPSGDAAFAQAANGAGDVIVVGGNGTDASDLTLTRPAYDPAGDGTGVAQEIATITVNGAISYNPVRTGS